MKDTISSLQWLSALTTPITAVLMLSFVSMIVSAAGRGAYISCLLMALLTFALLFLVIMLMRLNDFCSPTLAAAAFFPPVAAKGLVLFSGLFFLFLSVITLNIYVYIVNYFFLPGTPDAILALILYLPAVYMAYCGLRTFTYMTSASLLAFFLFLLFFLFTKDNYLLSNLFPLNDFKWKDVISAVPGLLLSAPSLLFGFFLLPRCDDRNRLRIKAALFCLLFLLVTEYIYAMGMSYFGERVITKLVMPFYHLDPVFKGNLLERFDIFFMLTLLPVISIATAYGPALFAEILRELNTEHESRIKPLIILAGGSVVLLSALSVNRISLWHWYRLGNIGALILLLSWIVVYALAAVKRRRSPSKK